MHAGLQLTPTGIKTNYNSPYYFLFMIEGESVHVAEDIGEGLMASIQSHHSDNTLMQLFWEEQKKALTTSPKGKDY